jgi:hypothetical protein
LRAIRHDGTAPSYPRSNHVVANHIHDIGLWTKQVAGFTQFVSARTTLARNVIYNTPRAGINLNDNFGGGNVVEQNAVFNTVRETVRTAQPSPAQCSAAQRSAHMSVHLYA